MTVLEIDSQDQPDMPLTEAAGHLVSRPSLNTIRRWAGRGVRGVKLRSWLIGGRRFTSRRAIAEFLRALSEDSAGQPR